MHTMQILKMPQFEQTVRFFVLCLSQQIMNFPFMSIADCCSREGTLCSVRWGIYMYINHRHFSDISLIFHRHFTDISQILHRYFTDISQTFQKYFTYITQTFHRHFTNISQTFHRNFTHTSHTFHRYFQIFHRHFTRRISPI